jgi:phenylacetate-CoA ligase
VRVVDNAGMEVADGETGEIVVSCFYNPATVLLNYRLGDLGMISREACGCGRNFARILALQGRISETIELANGRVVPVGAFLGRFREDTQGALRVRVLSGGKGRVLWQLVPGTAVDREAMRRRIVGRCSAVFGELLEADVEFVDEIPAQPSGKFS